MKVVRLSALRTGRLYGNRARDLPTCSAVPQLTALRRTPLSSTVFHQNQHLCIEYFHSFSTWCCVYTRDVSTADGRTVRHLSLVFCYLLSLAAIFVTCVLCAPFHFLVLFLFKICRRKCNWIVCISPPPERGTLSIGCWVKAWKRV
jgi:hypothetical protein